MQSANFIHLKKPVLMYLGLVVCLVIALGVCVYFYLQNVNYGAQNGLLLQKLQTLNNQFSAVNDKYNNLASQDQVKLNLQLKSEIDNIHSTYQKSVSIYEQIVDLRDQKQDTKKLDEQFAQDLKFLSDQNYASASANLNDLSKQIDDLNTKVAVAQAPKATPPPVNNTPPNSGFSSQQVQTSKGTFTVYIIAADLNTTKVIVDTASDSDCSNNCPVLPLANYVSRNGAFAGINGAFFCPASYPSCIGKTNAFDTLLMNKNKVYFNSTNNVYSTVPAAIFSSGSVRFVTQSLQWGRDTSVDAVIANYPLLVYGGQNIYSGSSDPKFGSKGARSFIANRGNMVYIGAVLNATMDESAEVLKTLGFDNALNLDEGGSTALWFGGYKLGPGRDLPDAVLFIKR